MRGKDSTEGGRRDSDLPPSPSSRVRLEIDILASELAAADSSGAARDTMPAYSILVVTTNAALASYIAECLAVRSDVRISTADSIAAAVITAQYTHTHMVIADAARADIVAHVTGVPAIVIADEAFDAAFARTDIPLAVIVQPFNARSLLSEVERLLAPRRSL